MLNECLHLSHDPSTTDDWRRCSRCGRVERKRYGVWVVTHYVKPARKRKHSSDFQQKNLWEG